MAGDTGHGGGGRFVLDREGDGVEGFPRSIASLVSSILRITPDRTDMV